MGNMITQKQKDQVFAGLKHQHQQKQTIQENAQQNAENRGRRPVQRVQSSRDNTVQPNSSLAFHHRFATRYKNAQHPQVAQLLMQPVHANATR